MSNPFEKYLQATIRQTTNLQSKTNPMMDTTLNALVPNFNNVAMPTNFSKSVGDHLGDTATDAAKALLTAQGVAVSAVDLGMYSLGGLGSLAQTIGHTVAPDTIPEVVVPEYGVGSKALNDTFGVNIADAKQNLGNVFYSDARKKQEAELQAGYTDSQMSDWKKSWEDSYATQLTGLQKTGATEQQLKDFNDGFNKQYQEAAKQFVASKQTSWDKSLGENAKIVGDAFGYVADNPSLGVGAAIDSMGYLLPSMSVSRGVQALQNAAKAASVGGKAIAAGVGEGSVSSLAIAEQMRNNSTTGTIDGGKVLAAAAAGTLTGLIGGASNKLGARLGLHEVDSLGLAPALVTAAETRVPKIIKPIAAIGQEGGEEFLQGMGETIIPNIAEGKDPLAGLNQELALGTFAGALMGAGSNAPSLVGGAASDIKAGFNKTKEVVGDATSLKSFDTLSNPEHKNYNPAQAFNLQLKNLESNDETVRTQAQASVDKLHADLQTTIDSTNEQIGNIDTALKAMPPVAQMTDAQKLEVDALTKEQGNLTAKSNQLTDHFVALVDAQVMAQENRDAKQGTQFTEEQAKADIATLTQPQTSTAVWSTAREDVPIEVTGEAYTDDAGDLYLPVRYELHGEMVDASVPANEVTSQSNPTDPNAQQQALDRVTRHFSKYSNDDLDLLATSPVFSEQQRNSLRLMSESKRQLAAVQDPSQVFDNILNGYKGKTIQESHRGLNQYTDMVNTAIATKNERLATLALDGLGAFTDDHTAKKDTINEAFGLVQNGTYKEIRVVRTEDGTWGFVPFTAQEVRAGKNADGVVFLEDDALKAELNAVGGYNVHRNSDLPTKGRTIGAITQINNETQLIQDRFDALSGVAESFVGVTPKPVDTSTVPTVDAPIITEPSDTTAIVDNPASEVPVQSVAMTPEVSQSLEGYIKSIGTKITDKYKNDLLTTFSEEVDKGISKGYVGGLVGSTKEYNKLRHAILVAIAASKGYTVGTPVVGNGAYTATLTKSTATPNTPATPTELKKGTVVEYKLNKYLFVSQDKYGNATLSNMDGSKFYTTPKVGTLTLLEDPKVTGEAKTTTPSQDNTGDTTQDRPSDQTPTGQQDSGSGEAVLGTESQDVPTRLVIDEQVTTEPVVTEDAKVTVLQGVTDELALEERKKPFNLRNILKGYFTQSSTKEGAVGANPLVTVKDFLKGLGTLTQVSDWLNDRRKPTEKQLAQVEHFQKFHVEFAKALNLVFNTQVAAKYVSNMENLVGYMEMGKKASTRKLDANVVTALALSAYSYLIKQGNKVMNTTEELETLFRLKKGVRAPFEIEQMFRFAGQEMPIVVKALGTDAAKALGLKVREDQDPTLQDRLNTSLGILVLEAMAKAGFVVIDTLEGKPLTDFLTAIKTVRESKARTSEDEYDFEVDTDAETEISKFTMVRPNALMEGESKTVFDGNRPVLAEGLPTLNSPLVNELIEANKDTKGFLSYLFGVDVGLTTPLKEIPKKFSQKLINGTDASVPSVQAELLTEAQKHSFTMRTNTVAVFAAMQKLGENSQFLKEVLGIWVDDHVLSRTHVTERDSLQAKAQNDWMAVLNGLEWADATLDENGQYTQFYDTQFVAQNQRQHLNSNMFSAQSSQIHRAMAALTGFSTTLDLSQDEQGTIKDEALLNLFYQAVGEGLEGLDDYLKADILSKAEAGLHQFFTVDKVYGDYYVPALKAFLQTTESKAAVEAMRALIETGTINTEQQKAIAAFVDKGKMGAQSLQSLIALAELSIAQANGTTFTTTIGFGSDGVNHGVSAANVLTGVISKDMRQQTGIFPIAEKGQDQISNMQEVYRRKITDYYVDFGKVMSGKLRDIIDNYTGGKNNSFVQGMTALFPKFEVLDDTGELRNLLDMRKIAKIWAIPFNYSAGKAALQRALARGFLAGIYGNMNKLANEALDTIDAGRKEGVTEEEKAVLRLKLETVKLKTKTLEDNLNKVLRKYGTSVTLPAPQLLNEEAQGKLSKELENTFMEAVIELHGEAAWQATEEFAKEYLQVRNVYTEAEKASFTLFDLVRTQLIEEKKANRKYTNVNAKVQVKGKTVQYTAEELNAQEAEYFGLTTVEMAEVDAELAAMRPMFNTALSIPSESTNDAGSVTNPSGVSVRKHKMQREPASGLRAVSTFYGTPRAESRNIGLTKEVEENAGVASSANAIQSIDAFVAAKIQGFMVALNAHDNAIFGLKDFLKGTKKQNEEHLKALTNYQLGLEHAKMLVKVYQGYKAFMATQEEALKTAEGKVKENIQSIIHQANKEMDKLLKGEVLQKNGKDLVIKGEIISKGGLIPKLKAAGIAIDANADIAVAIGMFIDFAINQDVKKLGMLKDTFGIHQFAGEGGMHQVTDENRAAITEQEALVKKAKEELQSELTGKPVEQVAEVKTPKVTKPTTSISRLDDIWGATPKSDLILFLEAETAANAANTDPLFKTEWIGGQQLVEFLKRVPEKQTKEWLQEQEVLKAIEPLLPKFIKVFYQDFAEEGYGYYDETTNSLYIKPHGLEGSKVDSHLIIHELLHSAFSQRIKAIRANPSKYPEAKAALDKLDELRQVILSRVKGNSVLSEMLKNVDEFISYGLTDQRLQQVLGAVPVERGGRTAPKVNSKWRTFVLAVMKVTGFKSGGTITALSAFAMDTAALLETIGSVAPAITTNNGERLFSTQSAEDLVNGQSSLDIMQALPHSNTGAFNQQLDRLIVEEIGQLYNQDDAAKARIDELQTFTASDALNAGFTLSRKEQYVQQALQYAVAAYRKLHGGGANEGQLNRVYHAAKVKISPTGKDFHEGDWATATQQEQDAAKAKYDFLFDSTKEGYMDRFVSMALASESVSKILDIALPLTKPETQDKTWFEKVSDWVSYVMAWLTNKYVRLNPTAGASNQLVQLMGNLVKLDIRARQEGVSFHQKAWNSIGLVTTPLNNALKSAQESALKGDSLRNSRFLPVRALGAAIVLRSEEAAKVIPQLILDMRNNQVPHTKLGEAANILMEAASAGSMRNAFDVLTRQTNLNAKNRQDIVDNVKKAVNAWFKTPLTKLQHKAVTYGLLRTDAQALLENYSVEDIVDMVLHEGKLNAEIAKLKKEIAKNPNGNDMLNAAEQLGYYMVTRIGGEGLVKNATGIAIGLGTQYFTSIEQADAKLVSQLDMLASMIAMTYVSNSEKGILAALYKTDKEGIHATITLHNGLVTQATGLFQDNPLNKVKGWMPDITNPYREIKTAESMAEREQMEAEGWIFIDEVKRDKHDKGDAKYLMKHSDIGYQRLVSGAVDLMNTARSGTEAIDRTNPKYLGITQARYQNAANRAAIPNGSFDPTKQPRGLITAYDTNGVALAYNYEMDNETRDEHLDRNHNIGDLLGTFGGRNYYMPVKTKQSNAVAQVLFEDYRENYSQNPNAYIKLSHKSTDPKVVEMWRMLPQDFKDQATALYGKGNPIVIRNEAFNFAFGFKKFSVVSYAFGTKAADRNKFQSGFVGFAEATSKFKSGVMGTFGGTNRSTAQADFAKAEHVTQEIVKAIKDFIVIRSGTTMMWNIFANVLMLMANGINPFTIVQDWVFAVTNVRAYQKLNSQLIQAQADLVAGKDPVALKQKIGALKAELKANKMNEYINAGLLSSIVEDVTIQHGDYTYNSEFKTFVDEKTQWIPKSAKTVAKVLTIAPSTKLYQFLATTTQLSDFVAKYTMSKHLQSTGMAVDESIVEASKTFINYDLPTSQGLQYANDMGLFMFTKFFLRIQAVLMKLMGKRAGSVIAQHILVESLTGAEGILSPSLFNHIGNNPLESSVFGLPSAFFSIGTVDAVTGLGSPF